MQATVKKKLGRPDACLVNFFSFLFQTDNRRNYSFLFLSIVFCMDLASVQY